MHVAILHNAIPPDAPLEDQDTLVQVEAVAAGLGRLGHRTSKVAATLDLSAMRDELLRLRPDVVFNLVESLDGSDSLMYLPLAVLDVLGLPYVGSHTRAMFLTTHKLLAKGWMQAAGLPTPAWIEGGKRGQAPFAGTARRVLRTNGACPLFPHFRRRRHDTGEAARGS